MGRCVFKCVGVIQIIDTTQVRIEDNSTSFTNRNFMGKILSSHSSFRYPLQKNKDKIYFLWKFLF